MCLSAAALSLAAILAACNSVTVTTYPPGSPARASATASPSSPASAAVSEQPLITGPAPSEDVTAFYYPWYRNPTSDGSWVHWNQLQHHPPDDIASSFYPLPGAYSSTDEATVADQMRDLRAARIGVISVSWWGQGSIEDKVLPLLFTQAAAYGIRIAFHLEPYTGQTAESMAADIHYLLARYGTAPALYRVSRATAGDSSTQSRPVFYVFAASRLVSADLKTAIAGLRGTPDDAIVMIHSPKAVSATRVGADGVYTYDATSDPSALASLVSDCRTAGIICSPSVAPGFDNRQAVATGIQVVDRSDGARYDQMWQAVLAAAPEWVSVTSFNEWHEGTQIEPATVYSAGGRTYESYDGAYGQTGTAAQTAYLERTASWIGKMAGS